MSGTYQTWQIDEPYVNPKCTLGEGPAFDEPTGKLRFLDIEGSQIFWLDPEKGPESLERMSTTDRVGFSSDISGDPSNLIVGAKYGFAYMSKATGELTYITQPSDLWDQPGEIANGSSAATVENYKPLRMRFNDGNIDPQGRFWCGMMNDPKHMDPPEAEGAVFVLEADGKTVRRAVDKVKVPNGMGWSEDGRTMYLTDSPDKEILACDFDGETGTISNRRVWFDAKPIVGDDDLPVPDGFCQDEQGCFWIALFGGGKVIRVKDEGGKGVVIGEVRLPTDKPTCSRIIGTTLWITTAGSGDEWSSETAKKNAGAVFAIDVGVGPRKMTKWKRPVS